jgi:radical SAM/Cys-rich protein
MRSLKANKDVLADASVQLNVLQNQGSYDLVPFQSKLAESGLYPLRPLEPEIMQINVGKMCNQVCKHCHVDAGPDRKEIMTKETMQQCLDLLDRSPQFSTVDLTGGAPEMNPDFRWFVTEITKRNRKVIVRCNLTIILANKKYNDLPEFFRSHRIEVVSSLPFYSQDRTDRQRGDGVFEKSIQALRLLNRAGYGLAGSGLTLNLVYNPAGAFLPPAQQELENQYKQRLFKDYDIVFNNLFTITNMPVSRYLDYLLNTGNYESYMHKLLTAYNPNAAANVMCRNTISIGWDGYVYDCDFNQMLELRIDHPQNHISSLDLTVINNRNIIIGQHCFGCTAGAGSSCGGAVT